MHFESQAAYEHYYSAEQRRLRSERIAVDKEQVLSEAWALLDSGNEIAARQRLFDAGIQDDGISFYIQSWLSD